MRKSEKITSYIDNAYQDVIERRTRKENEKARKESIGPDAERRKSLPKLIDEIIQKRGLSLREAVIELIKTEDFQRDFKYLINAKGITEEKIIESLEHRYRATANRKAQREIG